MNIDYSWDFTKEEFSLDLDFFNEKEQEDKLWQARTGLNHETLCGAIETIIFMSDKPVDLIKIKKQIDPDLPIRVVHESIARLQEEYEAKHHGIRLMEVANGYQFRTKATYSKIIQNMFSVASLQLSPTALEVLAIIAYKQPISKTAIESIRGVDSSHVARQLMDKRLVRIVGRSDEMGRPSLYGTTNEFLEVFNLARIEDLPSESELDELASSSDIGEISDIKSIVTSGDKKRFDLDELEELDELSSQISEISAETMFTKTLKSMDKKRSTEEGVEKKSAFDILEEFVNEAQIVGQNKEAIVSEILLNVLNPRSVNVTATDELLNAPLIDEEDDDFIIDIELESEDKERELPPVELVLEENFDDTEMVEVEDNVDELLAKSDQLLEEFTTEDFDQAIEAIEEVAAEEAKDEAQELADELDMAFDNLIARSEELSEDSEEEATEETEVEEEHLSLQNDIGSIDPDLIQE